MKRFMIFLLTLLLVLPVLAQDTIEPIPDVPPPDRHSFDCLGNADAVFYIGPNCINPVVWDLEGYRKLGTWAFFDDDAGLIVGFVWNWRTQEYDYLLLTDEHDAIIGYAGQYEIVPDSLITYP